MKVKLSIFVIFTLYLTASNSNLFKDNGCREAYLYHFLDRACCFGDEIGVKILLSQGADPNGSGYKKYPDCIGIGLEFSSPLFQASINGHLNIVKLLLEKKANPNIMVGEGITPLLVAVEKNFIDIVKILIKYGAKVYIKGLIHNPIQIAKEKKYYEIQKLLEEIK